MIKSKLRIGYIIFTIILIFIMSAILTFSLLAFCFPETPLIGFILLFLLVMTILLYLIYSECKQITIDPKRGYLKWTSLFHPQGKIIYLSNLTGIIRTVQTSKLMERPVVNLVDRDKRICLRINGFFCKNTEELAAALNLPEIKNFTQNIFTGVIRIE